MVLSAHGSYTISVKNNRLLVDAKGPFNLQTIELYRKELETALNSLKGSLWNQIIILHDMSIFTPDAAKELSSANAWRKSLGLQKSAVVLVNPIGAVVIKEQMAKIYRDADIGYEFFDDINLAHAWIDASEDSDELPSMAY